MSCSPIGVSFGRKAGTTESDRFCQHYAEPPDTTRRLTPPLRVSRFRRHRFGWLCTLFLCVSACTTVDTGKKSPNWPDNMLVIEHKVSMAETISHCWKWAPPGMIPLACSEWDTNIRECHIWYFASFALEHEREHCKGFIFHE